MSLLDRARDDRRTDDSDDAAPEPTGATSVSLSGSRDATTTVAGEAVTVERPDTKQTDEDTWLTGANQYGRPRGREALQARELAQTWPFELITTEIASQLIGGDLAFESDDDELDAAEADLQAIVEDVLRGPHLMDDDLDDLITAAVADMLGIGNAYWHLLEPETGDLPVVSLVPLDALTIRHNVDEHGYPGDPAYYQAPGAFAGGDVAQLGGIDSVALAADDLAVMRYPKGRRSYQVYPESPAMQVERTLELLMNSTTHHNRFYSDNQVPPGFVQIMNGSDRTVKQIQDKIQSAASDPRKVEVVGGEGAAQWIEMGGTAVNLNVIEEQKWFLQLCLAAVGLNKQEIGLVEDVNRNTSETQASTVFKKVTQPFEKQLSAAMTHVAAQFDLYEQLDRPFRPRIRFSDPVQERAQEQHLREQWEAGALTLRQYVRRRGDADLADNEFTVTIGGEEIAYGDHPKFVVDELLRAARADVPEDAVDGDE